MRLSATIATGIGAEVSKCRSAGAGCGSRVAAWPAGVMQPIAEWGRAVVKSSTQPATTARTTVSADGEPITVHIPLTFRRRGGR